LAVANLGSYPTGYISTVSVLLGNGDGTFQTARTFISAQNSAAIPQGIAVGDFNGDRVQDLAVSNITVHNEPIGSVSVLLGKGDGTFQAALFNNAGGGARSVAVGDFNGDGKPDLAVAIDGRPSGPCPRA